MTEFEIPETKIDGYAKARDTGIFYLWRNLDLFEGVRLEALEKRFHDTVQSMDEAIHVARQDLGEFLPKN